MAKDSFKIGKSLTLKSQSSAPVTDVENGDVYYDTTAGFQFREDGSWKGLGSGGSGSGGINYIAVAPNGTPGNADAENNSTTGWATYADAAASTPVDGTGGSSSLTFSAQASNILRGNYSFRLAKAAANEQGEGVSYAFSTDAADDSKVLQISFDVDASNANYADNDIGIYIYDVTNATLITPSVTGIKKAKYKFQASFLASTSNSYRLIFHVASTNATAYNLDFDNVSVGPAEVIQGVPVASLGDVAITINGAGTVTDATYTGFRIGNKLKVFGQFRAGTVAASTFSLDLPPGLTLDYSLYDGNQRLVVGDGRDISTGVSGTMTQFWLFPDGVDTNTLFIGYRSNTNSFLKENANVQIANSQFFSFWFEVYIAEWAGSTVSLDNTRVEYASNSSTADADDTTSFAYGPNGELIPTITAGFSSAASKRVNFITPIQSTDTLEIQIQIAGTGPWFSIGALGGSKVTTGITIPGYNLLTFQDNAAGGSNDRPYGIGLRPVSGSSTAIDVVFGRGGAVHSNAGYSTDGLSYPTTAGDRYRVVKCSNPLSIGQTQKLPTEMTDETATALGLKTYFHGTSYNGGNAPTVSAGTGSTTATVTRGEFIPYQTQNGNWRCRFNVNVTCSNTSRTEYSIQVNGLVWLAGLATLGQSFSGSNNAAGAYISRSFADGSNDSGKNMKIVHATANTSEYCFSGDMACNSKPTWAY